MGKTKKGEKKQPSYMAREAEEAADAAKKKAAKEKKVKFVVARHILIGDQEKI